jgi:cation transport regulator
MPYRHTTELPLSVRKALPPHAQSIYLAAFNNAWREYGAPVKRRVLTSLEETAHRVAWSAVKAKYLKQGDVWISRSALHPVSPSILLRKSA